MQGNHCEEDSGLDHGGGLGMKRIQWPTPPPQRASLAQGPRLMAGKGGNFKLRKHMCNKKGFKFGEDLRKERNTPATESRGLRKGKEGSAANSALGQGGEGRKRGLGPSWSSPIPVH